MKDTYYLGEYWELLSKESDFDLVESIVDSIEKAVSGWNQDWFFDSGVAAGYVTYHLNRKRQEVPCWKFDGWDECINEYVRLVLDRAGYLREVVGNFKVLCDKENFLVESLEPTTSVKSLRQSMADSGWKVGKISKTKTKIERFRVNIADRKFAQAETPLASHFRTIAAANHRENTKRSIVES